VTRWHPARGIGSRSNPGTRASRPGALRGSAAKPKPGPRSCILGGCAGRTSNPPRRSSTTGPTIRRPGRDPRRFLSLLLASSRLARPSGASRIAPYTVARIGAGSGRRGSAAYPAMLWRVVRYAYTLTGTRCPELGTGRQCAAYVGSTPTRVPSNAGGPGRQRSRSRQAKRHAVPGCR